MSLIYFIFSYVLSLTSELLNMEVGCGDVEGFEWIRAGFDSRCWDNAWTSVWSGM